MGLSNYFSVIYALHNLLSGLQTITIVESSVAQQSVCYLLFSPIIVANVRPHPQKSGWAPYLRSSSTTLSSPFLHVAGPLLHLPLSMREIAVQVRRPNASRASLAQVT